VPRLGLAIAAVVVAILALLLAGALKGRNRYSPRPSVAPVVVSSASTVPLVSVPSVSSVSGSSVSGGSSGDLFVSPLSVGRSVGAGTVGPPPSEVVVGDLVLSVDGMVLADRVVDGCLVVDAQNVTVRNVVVRCDGFHGVSVGAVDGFRIENSTVDCLGRPAKGIYFHGASGFVVDRVEITGCDDQFFIDGGLGVSSITNSVFHNQSPGAGAHTDGMQIGEFEVTTGNLTVAYNWWEYNRAGCCANAVLFATKKSALTVDVRGNFLDGDFGTHVLRCVAASVCNIEGNTLGGVPSGRFFHSTGNSGVARCNRYRDGQLIPDQLYWGITIDNTNC